jgi:hypothetical protein
MKKSSASCEKPVLVIPVSPFAKRCRSDSTENDFELRQERPSTEANPNPSSLHFDSKSGETPFMYHRRKDFEASLLPQQYKIQRLSCLREISPQGLLSWVRNNLDTLDAKFVKPNHHTSYNVCLASFPIVSGTD